MVGNTGAGKSTVGRALAAQLGLAYLELDAVFWGPGWQMVSDDEGRRAIDRVLAAPRAQAGWVVDGNWNSRIGDTLGALDTVVWLDYSRWVVMTRVVRRTVLRLVCRRPLWNGNRERWANLVSRRPDDNIILWAWTQHSPSRAQHEQRMGTGDIRWVRLRSPRSTRQWLATMGER